METLIHTRKIFIQVMMYFVRINTNNINPLIKESLNGTDQRVKEFTGEVDR
jgi:hypothetical protein